MLLCVSFRQSLQMLLYQSLLSVMLRFHVLFHLLLPKIFLTSKCINFDEILVIKEKDDRLLIVYQYCKLHGSRLHFSSVVYKPRVQWLSFILLVRLSRPSVALGYSDQSLHVTSLELQHTAPLGGVVHGLLKVVGNSPGSASICLQSIDKSW